MKAFILARRNLAALAVSGALVAGLTGTLVSTTASASSAATASPANTSGYPSVAITPVQRTVYQVIHQYQTGLNTGNTKAIVDLFAPGGVAEWNDKVTYATRQQKIDGYDALFRTAKFSTAFAYDAINVYGTTAVVRTHHHVGQTVIENGKEVQDYNREVFVLRKTGDAWKIVLYTFNTDPVQGQG
ncbi:nuclear transport factor 2 family protein [Streptomyces sp. NPDC097640]|uniref:YybH family protein n=1 Tax=Streptomyces sp. NPDC097640 TaxID=3157229 RepID=UPI00332B1204